LIGLRPESASRECQVMLSDAEVRCYG